MPTKSLPFVAIVTAAKMPKPDLEIMDLSEDLKRAGFDVSIVP
jgi:hypothetical protein